MKTETRRFHASNLAAVVTLGMLYLPLRAAQAAAPASLVGSLLTVQVQNGRQPFASSGAYKLFISAAGTNYTVLGRAGLLSSGGYTYSAIDTAGKVTLMDRSAGSAIALTLIFASPTNGTLALTNADGFQMATFTRTVYSSGSQPSFLLPGFSNGQFYAYLSGQPGYTYAMEVSSNLASWQPVSSVALDD